jgi:predicted kinase
MATAHLVHGFLGAGKTTLAKALEEQHRAIRLSIDDWYLTLFAEGPTHHLDSDKLQRVEKQLDELWPQLLKQGLDVVLDFGFWHRSRRDTARALARAAGATTVLYEVHCEPEVALQRCLHRNGDATAFLISAEEFTFLQGRFEPLQADEESVRSQG